MNHLKIIIGKIGNTFYLYSQLIKVIKIISEFRKKISMSNSKLNNAFLIQRCQKEFLIFIIIFSFTISSLIFFTYIQNSPTKPTDLPRIYIVYEEELNNKNYVDCTFELVSEDESERVLPIKSKIKIRGSFNAEMPKKGYRIELSERKSLLGLRKDDDWQLFAMFLDLSSMRVKLSFDLWRSLQSTNPTAILPRSKFVTLYINGEFQGLYLFSEKNDRRLYGLNDPLKNINSSLIFQAGARFDDFKNYKYSDWQQDWPNEDDGIYIMDEIMTSLFHFISQTSDSEFFNQSSGIYSKFDKLNLIDFYLFNFFILHKDFWGQNYFLVRNSYPNYYYLIPWDFDSSFGQYLGRKYSPTEDPSEDIFQRNYLYYRLLNDVEFRISAKDRWFYLRQSLWTEEFILDKVSEMYEDIKNTLEIDANTWYSLIFDNKFESETDDAINYLFEWISDRIAFCDSYFLDF